MKKIISFCFASFLLTVVAFGQEASTTLAKKDCTPTKECAEKMGMTLEQCKALCKKACTKSTATASTTETAEVKLASTGTSADKATKKCCATMKECAQKMGMTLEECKAKCKGKVASASNSTAVASAVMVNTTDADANSQPAKKACSSKKACCKKKQ